MPTLKLPVLKLSAHTNTKRLIFELDGGQRYAGELTITLLPPPMSYVQEEPKALSGSLLKLELDKGVSVDEIPQIIEALQHVKRLSDEFPTWVHPQPTRFQAKP